MNVMKGTRHGATGQGWAGSLAAVMAAHNQTKTNGTKAGHATSSKRRQVLFAGFKTLRALGYRLERVESFGGRHMQALVDHWVGEGLSPSSVQNRLSVFRVFASWIGKNGMIETSTRYVTDPATVRRTSVATSDKSWTPRGFNVADIIGQVHALDPRVAMALELQHAYGLRVRESLMLKPHLADLGQVLDVKRGTKNGRPRTLRIEREDQRDVLDRAKALVGSPDESIAGPAELRALHQVRNHYYSVVRKVGIRCELGITSHGLRHEAANAYFAGKAGYSSPVQGGPAPTDKATERFARLQTAEHLGHSREDVTTHYLGRARAKMTVGQ